MKLEEQIISETTLSVGYLEAKNKESFLVGARVAFSKTEEHFEKETESLKRELLHYKTQYAIATSDLKTLASIITRYSQE